MFSDTEYLAKLRRGPDILQHIHWDGSIPSDKLFELSRKRGVELSLPATDMQGNPIEDRRIDTPEKLAEFQQGLLTRYGLLDVFAVPISFMQTREDLIEMAKAHCDYLQSRNVPYAETRFAPQYHTQKGLSLTQVIGHALEGFAMAGERTGVVVKPIICIGREADDELGVAVVKAALQFPDVVGIDLACYEPGNPPEKHYKAFRLTFDSHLYRTVHAGEMCSEQENISNVRTALGLLRADALSHAVQLYRYPNLVEMMIGRRLESNPISNANFFVKSVSDLHLDELARAGVKVTVNPDDPMMWPDGHQEHNLYLLGKLYGDEFVRTVRRNAVETAWGLSDEEKQKYLSEAS